MPAPRSFPWLALVAVPALAVAAALAVRLLAIEPAAVGQACDLKPWEGWCAARTALVVSFRHKELGWFALAVALAATMVRRRWLGCAALCLGLTGLILYSWEPAAVAAVLGVLVILRSRTPTARQTSAATA